MNIRRLLNGFTIEIDEFEPSFCLTLVPLLTLNVPEDPNEWLELLCTDLCDISDSFLSKLFSGRPWGTQD